MTGSNLLDSSVWISYFFDGLRRENIENDDLLLLSALSLFEIKSKLIRKKVSADIIEKNIKFIKKRSMIISLDDNIAEKAAEISVEKGIPAADSLIYATSLLNNSTLLTLDNDFRGLNGVIVLK